jgi:hypothetical protein
MKDYRSEKYSSEDPVKMLAEARAAIKELKARERGRKLPHSHDNLLLKNNSKFAELVLVLEKKVKALTEEQAKIYKYSYGKGWIEKDSADPKKLKIMKGKVSVQEINCQLEEILRLIRTHSRNE